MDNKKDKIINYKLELVLNRSLYKDNIIKEEIYKIAETNILKKINELEMIN